MSNSLPRMVRNAMIMMIGTFASRILGLAREIMIAAFFGASRQLDAFYIAYTLANLSRQLLAEGALSAAFVPVFSKVLQKDGKDRARDLAKQATGVLFVAGTLTVIAGILLSPFLVSIMAPGFDAGKHAMATAFTRAMFPFLLFVSMGALAMGALNSMDYYFIPAVAPALSNVIFIVTVILLASKFGIWCLVLSVLLGGCAQFLLQWYWTHRVDMFLWPVRPRRKDKDLSEMMRLFFPYAAGLSVNQLNPVISRILGSFLMDGAISILNYANRIIQLPLGMFVVAISQAVLPELSRSTLEGDSHFGELMAQSVRFTLFIVLPATVGLIFIAEETVNLLFYRGAFGMWAWKATSSSLAMYSIGLPGMACNTVLMRGLYAISSPRSAILVTMTSVAANIIFSVALMGFMSYNGLALANSIAFTISAFAGWIIIKRYLKGTFNIFSIGWLLKLALSLAIMSLSLLAVKHILPFQVSWNFIVKTAWIFMVVLLSVTIYGITTWKLKFSECGWIRNALRRKS